MGYSKETERQNRVLGDLLQGKTPEKRIMVGYEGKKEKKADNVSKMTELMQEARMPLFCKACDSLNPSLPRKAFATPPAVVPLKGP